MSSNTDEKEPEQETTQNDKEYEILREDYPNYDLSFKIIVIGNSGKKTLIYLKLNRSWKIMFINSSNKT